MAELARTAAHSLALYVITADVRSHITLNESGRKDLSVVEKNETISAKHDVTSSGSAMELSIVQAASSVFVVDLDTSSSLQKTLSINQSGSGSVMNLSGSVGASSKFSLSQARSGTYANIDITVGKIGVLNTDQRDGQASFGSANKPAKMVIGSSSNAVAYHFDENSQGDLNVILENGVSYSIIQNSNQSVIRNNVTVAASGTSKITQASVSQ